jgi:hypothetical protein
MDWLITPLNELGWLGTLLGIVTFIGTSIGVFVRFISPRIGASRLDKAIPYGFETNWDPKKAKAWARIAIVDDQPNDFPASELKADGFHIQILKSATLSTTAQLSQQDIVFLDMKGIVKDDPENGGLKLIAELRKTNPHQKICAVSSKTFDPTATEFFRKANDYKKKPLTAHECRDVINNFLIELFPANTLIAAATLVVNALPRSSRIAVIAEFLRLKNNHIDEANFLHKLQKMGLTASQYGPILNLARAIVHESD